VKKMRRQRGFTLLEIMIALTIFAVISTLAWQILDGAMRTSSATDASAAKLNQLQRAWSLMERDFFQLQARAPRNEPELFRQAQLITSRTLEVFTMYLAASLIYWVMATVLSSLQNYFENQLNRQERDPK